MLTPELQSHVADFARSAMLRWVPAEATVSHIADSGNSVWCVEHGGERTILRLTNPAYRSLAENAAETEYLRHLAANGVAVAEPIASLNGADVEELRIGDHILLASSFRWADGQLVGRDSPLWDTDFLRGWGGALGRIHRASETYVPRGAGRRWQWHDEVLLAQAAALFPPDDHEVRERYAEVMASVHALPRSAATFGMVHADFAPQNFRYDRQHGIVAFDFGNCCYHWYASDVAISLSVLGGLPEPQRSECRAWLVEGYLAERPEAASHLDTVPLFASLRAFYVYLSRLYKFGPEPTDEERAVLLRLRAHAIAVAA